MKRALLAMGIGVAGSILLLAVPYILPVDAAPLWLSRLVYGPGDQFFSWLKEHCHIGPGEKTHHSVVLATSLMCWWSIGSAITYLLASRGGRD